MTKNLKVTVNGIAYEVQIEEVIRETSATSEVIPNPRATINSAPSASSAPSTAKANGISSNGNGLGKVVAPMPGLIKQIKVTSGQKVEVGEILLVLEAMKLENEIKAKKAGTITGIFVEEGRTVSQGTVLVAID